MVLVKLASDPNPTLKGHKLFFVSEFEASDAYVASLQSKFPDLEIVRHDLAREDDDEGGAPISRDEWKDVTIMLTSRMYPNPKVVPKMQYVQLQSAGANHILNKKLFTDTDVVFCTANGVHGPQISEWIICTFLASQHFIPQYLEHQSQARWKRLNHPVNDTVGQRVGILGYGSIGRQTARVAKAMGMDVHAYTLHPRNTPESRYDDSYVPEGLGDPKGVFPSKWFSGGSKEDIHEFLGSGLDLLVIALPLTDKTRGMISTEEFEVMRERGTYVSNIGRGPIIDTDAIIKALNGDVIRGAALDVTDPEPLPDGHPLFSAKNLILTPHVSGNSSKYGERLLAILEYNLTRLSEGQELTNRVNRKEGY